MTDHSRRDLSVALLLATISLSTSVLLDAGLVGSNDGAHFALVRALADDHSPVIDRFVSYTRHVDLSERGGHFYSDRPPGTALLALPLYAAAKAMAASPEDQEAITALLAAALGALAVALTYLVGRRLGLARTPAALGALALALCTPLRTYSSALWSHAPSAFFEICAVWLALGIIARPASPPARRLLFLLGLTAGFAVGVDYSAAVSGGVICLAAAWPALAGKPARPAERAHALAPLAAGLLAGAAPALAYSWVAFGSPFATPYQYHLGFEVTRKLGDMYGGDFLDGFTGLLFRPRAGLLLYSPVLALGLWALPGWWRALGTRRAAAALLPGIAMLLLTSRHATWDGGAAHDARYLLLVIPAFCLPVGFFYAWARGGQGAPSRGGALALFWGLFYLSALVQAVKHAAGWMRSATPFVLQILDAASRSAPVPVRELLAWLFPHPLAAACVLALGLAGAALVWPRAAVEAAVAVPAALNPAGE
ncbi:MAG TPA: phospholipid carrier-dependent glycosyltransferase [Myxococcales bacterium]|nr:phospholipid carrier-dependent glycosyltransferase [Myxococcales bacterium]